ncbi:hypothetical protein [Stygiolobus sp. RP850M]
MKQTTSTFYNERGLRGQRASPAGMDSPVFKYFFVKISLSDANDALPQLD